jgi:hypothetical protein
VSIDQAPGDMIAMRRSRFARVGGSGMGEKEAFRIGMLYIRVTLPLQPVPANALVPSR